MALGRLHSAACWVLPPAEPRATCKQCDGERAPMGHQPALCLHHPFLHTHTRAPGPGCCCSMYEWLLHDAELGFSQEEEEEVWSMMRALRRMQRDGAQQAQQPKAPPQQEPQLQLQGWQQRTRQVLQPQPAQQQQQPQQEQEQQQLGVE